MSDNPGVLCDSETMSDVEDLSSLEYHSLVDEEQSVYESVLEEDSDNVCFSLVTIARRESAILLNFSCCKGPDESALWSRVLRGGRDRELYQDWCLPMDDGSSTSLAGCE